MRKPALNGRHLRTFACVMESRGLAEAALKLGISEAAVSKTLRLIEQEISVKLFTLEGGRLRPTAAAKQWLPYAQRAAQQLETAVSFAYDMSAGKPRPIIVAAHAPPLIAIVPKAIKRFCTETPDVEIDLRVEGPHDVLELVAHQEIDIGVTNQPLPQAQSNLELCKKKTISEDLLVVALPKQHRLNSLSVIRPADLLGERIIALPDDSPTTILIEATFHDEGVEITAPILARNSLGVCALVREGVGIGLINPLLLSNGIFPGVTTRPFRPRIALWTEIYYSSLRPLTPDALRLVKHLEDVAAELQTGGKSSSRRKLGGG